MSKVACDHNIIREDTFIVVSIIVPYLNSTHSYIDQQYYQSNLWYAGTIANQSPMSHSTWKMDHL